MVKKKKEKKKKKKKKFYWEKDVFKPSKAKKKQLYTRRIDFRFISEIKDLIISIS